MAAIAAGPLVVTAPAGAGKSTQVPRWCRRLGRVLVVEPRRVACRGLAQRVAELEGCRLGEAVGYSVRDEHRAGDDTEILFATPGIVLQWIAADRLPAFELIVLDEFHERRLDVDLLMALLSGAGHRLLVMSATLDGERVARHLGGQHLHAEGRCFPVAERYVLGEALLPSGRGLIDRVKAAVAMAQQDAGDLLVFLPGKREIAEAAAALRGHTELEVLTIHGGLSLDEQSRIFQPGAGRRAILATNVAETSITVPGVGVVIDGGLVRQTRYHQGRGYLTLVPVALDSAAQRAGRAGRLAPGVCYRLWSESANLAPVTPPEIHRESLTDLVLSAAACGRDVRELSFLDQPKEYAIETARHDLATLGILDEQSAITSRGRALFGLPLDVPLGNLIIEAERLGVLEDAIDLAAILSGGLPAGLLQVLDDEERKTLPEHGCDATALLRILRRGSTSRREHADGISRDTSRLRGRLRHAFGLPRDESSRPQVDRKRLALAAMAADPRCAYVARRRRGRTSWDNGGTLAVLGRETTVQPQKVAAVVALETRAFGQSGRKKSLVITCALPVPIGWLIEAGLGDVKPAAALLREGRPVARVQRMYAGQVLEEWEESPRGERARLAIRDLVLAGRIFRPCMTVLDERLGALELLSGVARAGLMEIHDTPPWPPERPVPAAAEWLLERLRELGVEEAGDLDLLDAEDLLPPVLPPTLKQKLDEAFPRRLSTGSGRFRVRYDLTKKEVTLEPVDRKLTAPPALGALPSFRGFRVRVQQHSRSWVLRERF